MLVELTEKEKHILRNLVQSEIVTVEVDDDSAERDEDLADLNALVEKLK